MKKRRILIGGYDTAAHGFTLCEWELDSAEYKENSVDIPGHDGSIDLSFILSDGIPRYESRTLTATLESSEGTRAERELCVSDMINRLDGFSADMVLPDDPHHFIRGRVHVERQYNDAAHAAVGISARCEPWRYAVNAVELHVPLSDTVEELILINAGRRPLIPSLSVSGGTAEISFGGASWTLSAGEYRIPDILLMPGESRMRVCGSGTLDISYREAVL